MTYALIAANVAAFLLLNVPLGSRQADLNSPGIPRVRRGDDARARRDASTSASSPPRRAPTTSSASSTATVRRRRSCGPGDVHVPARRLHAPVRQHAVPLDLRRQRRAPARLVRLSPLVPGDGRRRDAHARARVLVVRRCRSWARPERSRASSASTSCGSRSNVVRMLAFLPPFLMQVFEIPARFVLGMYLVCDNLCRSSSPARAASPTARTSAASSRAASWPG